MDIKVDNVGFNVDHWSKKTEAEFMDAEKHNAPANLSEADKTTWLENAFAKIMELASPVEKKKKAKPDIPVEQ